MYYTIPIPETDQATNLQALESRHCIHLRSHFKVSTVRAHVPHCKPLHPAERPAPLRHMGWDLPCSLPVPWPRINTLRLHSAYACFCRVTSVSINAPNVKTYGLGDGFKKAISSVRVSPESVFLSCCLGLGMTDAYTIVRLYWLSNPKWGWMCSHRNEGGWRQLPVGIPMKMLCSPLPKIALISSP